MVGWLAWGLLLCRFVGMELEERENLPLSPYIKWNITQNFMLPWVPAFLSQVLLNGLWLRWNHFIGWISNRESWLLPFILDTYPYHELFILCHPVYPLEFAFARQMNTGIYITSITRHHVIIISVTIIIQMWIARAFPFGFARSLFLNCSCFQLQKKLLPTENKAHYFLSRIIFSKIYLNLKRVKMRKECELHTKIQPCWFIHYNISKCWLNTDCVWLRPR